MVSEFHFDYKIVPVKWVNRFNFNRIVAVSLYKGKIMKNV